MAIEALQMEPHEDCISRQAAISVANSFDATQVVRGLEKLPSVQPEQKTGHWSHDGSHWKNRFICSECEYKLFDEPTNYCPNCGCRMEEGE